MGSTYPKPKHPSAIFAVGATLVCFLLLLGSWIEQVVVEEDERMLREIIQRTNELNRAGPVVIDSQIPAASPGMHTTYTDTGTNTDAGESIDGGDAESP